MRPLYFFLLWIPISLLAQSHKPLVDYVNPFIGVDNAGNVFPGATLPFGMVKLGPDCFSSKRWQTPNAGYESNNPVYGFSHTHVSGTGGGAKYGNIAFMPIIGNVNQRDISSLLIEEQASPGYFSAILQKYNIRIELTTTHSTGLHRYTFLKEGDAHVLIDAGSILYKGSTPQILISSGVEILSDTEIAGYGKAKSGWNVGDAYTVYFYAKFDTPMSDYGTMRNMQIKPGNKKEYALNTHDYSRNGGYFSYKVKAGTQLNVHVGISFVSIEKAKKNVEQEIGNNNFDIIYNKARAIWETYLEKVYIEGMTEEEQVMFYSALYRTILLPSNRTGENPDWDSPAPYYDDFYAIWDTFRSSNPLITLLWPDKQVEILNALINIYEHEGYMPDARSGNYNGMTQGGSNSDILIADAVVKGLKNFDIEKAFNAMIHNAEVPPSNPRKEGRGGLNEYKNSGYIPYPTERSCSRTLEYAYCDYATAIVAKHLGKKEVYNKYIQRARNWTNLWCDSIIHEGFQGFIWPRNEDGSWLYDPDFSVLKIGSWTNPFYESHSWEYSFYAPHDIAGLIEKCGGKARFIERLDHYFNKEYYKVSNEPGFLSPCLYIWAGAPYKTAEKVRQIIERNYNSSRTGLPGNDDSGAMSSWYVFHSMGLFPNAGQDYYLITAPRYPKITIKSGKTTFSILTQNTGNNNIYIRSALLNNKVLNRAWIKHEEILHGGTLVLIMDDKPSSWATQTSPPSL